MCECLFKLAWRTLLHSMLSICDAMSVYPTFVERTEGSECLRFFCFGKNNGGCLLPFVSSRMRSLHCKFFAWWACGRTGGSLLMHGLADGHHLHSCVLLFLCLYSLFTSCFMSLCMNLYCYTSNSARIIMWNWINYLVLRNINITYYGYGGTN